MVPPGIIGPFSASKRERQPKRAPPFVISSIDGNLQIHFVNNSCRFCGHFHPGRDKAALDGVSDRANIRPGCTIKWHRFMISLASALVSAEAIPCRLYAGRTSTPICHISSQSAEQAAKPTSVFPSYAPTPSTSNCFRSLQSALLHSGRYNGSKSSCFNMRVW